MTTKITTRYLHINMACVADTRQNGVKDADGNQVFIPTSKGIAPVILICDDDLAPIVTDGFYTLRIPVAEFNGVQSVKVFPPSSSTDANKYGDAVYPMGERDEIRADTVEKISKEEAMIKAVAKMNLELSEYTAQRKAAQAVEEARDAARAERAANAK